ncbi:GNAT family N-acetyltransferase [Bosea vestrisii]|uniref:GNAT family N-acetyltransferase n=1 Tax=Bosea vestrisii TaxID=151416 RepID=UPI0024DFF6D7|nr:GNAT family N-acetyltransferase [Bosea vestrisii]WID94834.1 GNAT family N-acetyltransferase [Bosea vestrisii]
MTSIQLTLRPAGLPDADACQSLSAAIDWPHRREDWEFALALGQGFIASSEEEVVGIGLWWGFGATHATLGTIVVAPDWQGQGIGKLLTEQLIAATEGQTLGLVATAQGEPLYAKYGFVAIDEVRQHQGGWPELGAPVLAANESMRPAAAADLPLLAQLDGEATGLPRAPVLEALLARGHAILIERDGAPAGFGFLRRHGHGWLIGPVAAVDDAAACNLIAALLAARRGDFVRIDVPARTGLGAWLSECGLPLVASSVVMERGAAPVAPGPMHRFALVNQAIG